MEAGESGEHLNPKPKRTGGDRGRHKKAAVGVPPGSPLVTFTVIIWFSKCGAGPFGGLQEAAGGIIYHIFYLFTIKILKGITFKTC